MAIPKLSTKGQITEFIVEETADGILLRPRGRFPETSLDQVAGCLRSRRKPQRPEQMSAAVARQVRKRHDRGRY
jgi:hypothetical protein